VVVVPAFDDFRGHVKGTSEWQFKFFAHLQVSGKTKISQLYLQRFIIIMSGHAKQVLKFDITMGHLLIRMHVVDRK
jgi:hypothetical protein